MSPLMSKVMSLKENIENLKAEKDVDKIEVLGEMSNILCELVEKIDLLENSVNEINDYVTVLDENLGNIEEEVYGFEEDEDEFDSYEYVDITCGGCQEILAIEKSILDNEEKMICPNCGETIDLKKHNN